MNRMLDAYRATITMGQTVVHSRKDSKRNWNEHYVFLMALSKDVQNAHQLVLENLVHYAAPEIETLMMAKYDPWTVDWQTHAEELVRYASLLDGRRKPKPLAEGAKFRPRQKGKGIQCFNCEGYGHKAHGCKKPVKENVPDKAGFSLSVVHEEKDQFPNDGWESWVHDSGASC
ncbi:TPA: hypothetical protein N0F65_005152 [Lagenidium giganteum]|uniref:CCHC-type domain-containing protein n=1 Tax=Lagenidium giganteum TaxID=4803 RepID=A0AAV2YZQ9_9STRA|nr:TPA: hypothetical protein N0F65_005152 [Lagenidium giganteum]